MKKDKRSRQFEIIDDDRLAGLDHFLLIDVDGSGTNGSLPLCSFLIGGKNVGSLFGCAFQNSGSGQPNTVVLDFVRVPDPPDRVMLKKDRNVIRGMTRREIHNAREFRSRGVGLAVECDRFRDADVFGIDQPAGVRRVKAYLLFLLRQQTRLERRLVVQY